MEQITQSAEETAKLLALFDLEIEEVISVESLPAQDVWDVSLIDQDVPVQYSIITNGIVTHNSTAGSPDYFENIFENKMKIEDVFGVRDPDTGEWAKVGPARLWTEDIAETFFNSMGSFLRKIPDKTCVDGQWYFVYDDTKINRKIVSDAYSKKMYSKFKQLYVPTLDTHPQAIIFLDSYPAMLGEKMDVDEPGSGMAAKARMFAENVPKVGSKIKRKCVNVIGVNQLRLRPGFTMGNPEYEPNGETLKFVSGIRLRQATCAVPHGSGQFEEEKGLFGGKDKYRYIKMKATKNKTSTPQLEGLFRLCIQNAEGLSTGFDKVYDCVTGDTLVQTNIGLLRIDEIPQYSNTQHVRSGLTHLTGLTALSHTGKYEPITQWKYKGVKDTSEVILKNGMYLKGTKNHLVRVINTLGNIEWKPIGNLTTGDCVIVSKVQAKFSRKTLKVDYEYFDNRKVMNTATTKSIVLNTDLAYLSGLLVSDGHLGKDGKQVNWYSSNQTLVDKVVNIATRVFGVPPKVYSYESKLSTKKAYKIYYCTKEIHSIFIALGHSVCKAKDKTVPEKIFRSPKHVVVSFLKGLYSGDGSVGTSDWTLYSSTSNVLMKQVNLLLWNFGIAANKTRTCGYSAREFKSKIGVCETKVLSDGDINLKETKSKAWEEKLPMPTGYGYNLTYENLVQKKPVVSSVNSKHIPEWRKVLIPLFKQGFRVSTVVSVKDSGKQKVYDIGVENSHSFVANGIVAHNCFQYLKLTGQATGTMKKMNIALPSFETKKPIDWMDFKGLVALNGSDLKDHCKDLKITSNPKVREQCLAQMKSGKGMKMYFDSLRKGAKDEGSDEESSDD